VLEGYELFMTFTILLLLYDYDLSSMHRSLLEFSFALHSNNFTLIKDGIK
jgi:hypothetical protein